MSPLVRVLVVDHHDSYTWNLVHLIASVTGELPDVVEHDEPFEVSAYSHLVLSPGPGHPAVPADFARADLFDAGLPVLGVCLGMQALVTHFGGSVEPIEPAHGELARISHDGTGLFDGLPDGFGAVRYHSLGAVELPDCLRRTATAADGVTMGVAHRERPLVGVQFHPESILSEYGAELVGNFLGTTRRDSRDGGARFAGRRGAIRGTARRDSRDDEARFAGRQGTTELRGADRCFWLDGGGSTSWSGSRSLVGVLDDDDVSLTYDATRHEVTRHRAGTSEVVGDDIFAVLEDSLDGSPDTHWVGYFGYASRPDLPARPAVGVPDAVWMQSRRVRWGEGRRVAPTVRTMPGEVPVEPAYVEAFERVQHELRSGNSYEVNLTYRALAQSGALPLDVYERLRASNPAPYSGYLAHHGTHLLSASPERFATIDRHGWVETRPIKGTTPRGTTEQEDARLRDLLASDTRFRAENLMIVDLLRNDLSMVCEPGTVTVPELMSVESYASVHQLVSTVRGRLRVDVSPVAAVRAMFPAGSMTGAPKLRTMDIIDDVEATPRGVYAGAFGWISGDGRADLGVVIRSLVCPPSGAWEVGTGGGVTVLSDPGEEWSETRWKADRVLGALEP